MDECVSVECERLVPVEIVALVEDEVGVGLVVEIGSRVDVCTVLGPEIELLVDVPEEVG